MIGPSQGIATYIGQKNTEKRGHISMPRAGFEPTISVFGRSKMFKPKTMRPLGSDRVIFVRQIYIHLC